MLEALMFGHAWCTTSVDSIQASGISKEPCKIVVFSYICFQTKVLFLCFLIVFICFISHDRLGHHEPRAQSPCIAANTNHAMIIFIYHFNIPTFDSITASSSLYTTHSRKYPLYTYRPMRYYLLNYYKTTGYCMVFCLWMHRVCYVRYAHSHICNARCVLTSKNG